MGYQSGHPIAEQAADVIGPTPQRRWRGSWRRRWGIGFMVANSCPMKPSGVQLSTPMVPRPG
jgi:hypothetical protein